MKIKVVNVDEFGAGYCVITRDDGTTLGQQFKDLPIQDAMEFDRAILSVAEEALKRTAPRVPQICDPTIATRIGVDIAVVKPG